jgi:hypothetical protein
MYKNGQGYYNIRIKKYAYTYIEVSPLRLNLILSFRELQLTNGMMNFYLANFNPAVGQVQQFSVLNASVQKYMAKDIFSAYVKEPPSLTRGGGHEREISNAGR